MELIKIIQIKGKRNFIDFLMQRKYDRKKVVKHLTLQQLKYVIEVAEKGSITEAAKSILISQPSLSNSIRDLEKEIKTIIFVRNSKGIALTNEGTKFLGYARQVIQQADLLESKYITETNAKQHFCVSTQHYTFASNAFVELVKEFGLEEYEFALNETKTYDIIEEVKNMFSEIGIIYLSNYNEIVIRKMLEENNLSFTELFTSKPHVFLSREHSLAKKKKLKLEDLDEYPCLSFCQGQNNSFYFSEEILSTRRVKKSIKVSDRAAIVNFMIGLNGYTISSGVFPKYLHGEAIISIPLDEDEKIQVGYILNQDRMISALGEKYIDALKKVAESL